MNESEVEVSTQLQRIDDKMSSTDGNDAPEFSFNFSDLSDDQVLVFVELFLWCSDSTLSYCILPDIVRRGGCVAGATAARTGGT